MDRISVKHIFILSFVIVHYVQLTKASSAGCLLNPNVCDLDEFCHQGYLLGRCVKRSQLEDYYYGHNREWLRNNEENNGLHTRREDIPQWKEPYRQRDYDRSEPTLEDKTLIQSLPLDSKEPETRNAYPMREDKKIPPFLPPNTIGARDGITLNNKEPETRNAFPVREDKKIPPILPPDSIGTRDGISVNNDARIPEDHIREYHSELLDEPHQTFHEANEQISIEHIPEPESKTLHGSEDEKSNIKDNSVESEDASDANSKVMIKGEVKKAESTIDQGPNPEKNYERIKDFFETQRASSIVDVPNAVKREEAAKVNKKNFVPIDKKVQDEVNAEEVSKPSEAERSIKIDLDRRVEKSGIKVQRVKNAYSPEDESDIAKRINQDSSVKENVARQIGVRIIKADEDTPSKYDTHIEPAASQQPKYFIITLITVGCVTGVVLSAVAVYLIMKRYNETKKFKPVTLPGQEAAAEYQELCRQFHASQGWDGSTIKPTDKDKTHGSTKPPPYSWSEEPVVPNMDISTGHVVLAYMEDHLNNKDRLNKEWEALCTYEAEPNKADMGKQEKNARKNRYSDVLPYDHNRVVLRETANATGSDYVNASFITDHDPRNPAYIATQGPLAHTVSDFWQMIWEQGVVVVVNLTRLSDLGLPQCNRYWPEEGHETYHIYEVHLVSEHIWCDDYLVRSFYLKNLQTSETRTVTQFHFLSWPDLNVPTNPKPLLEFRRKVNKCFRGRSCPIVVHCSGGVGRTGCYVLIDMVLNKMMRGAKEIDIAATVEHLRDQRPLMVKTKAQFEFALTAVAEEVSAILQALAK